MTARVPAALLGLLLPALALTGAAPATASDRPSVRTLHDGTGDVWMTPDGGDVASPAPDRRTGDIVTARIAHRPNAVVVRLRFADLSGPGSQRHELTLVTPTTRWFANVVASTANPAGRHHLWALTGDRVACAGMTHEVDGVNGVVRLRIPRRCLDRPRWVRVTENSGWHEGSTTYGDNPLNRDATAAGLSRRIYVD